MYSLLVVGAQGLFAHPIWESILIMNRYGMEILTDIHVFRPPEYEQVVSGMLSIHMYEYVHIMVYRLVAKQ
jgi:hypothetical protein